MGKKGEVTERKQKSKEDKRKKQEAKALKKQVKKGAGGAAAGGDEEDDAEFDALVKQLTQRDLAKTAITVERLAEVPSARASFTVNLGGNGELIVFGGEYFDGATSRCFDDVLRFTPGTKPGAGGAWKRILSENSPPPRCAHCAAATPTHLYLFGGELSSKYQFHHLNDLWRLDLKTNAWAIMPSTNGPSPRSGARMVVWRNFLIVFGGFYEASRGVRWHDDLFFFDMRTEKWSRAKLETGPASSHPSARSGFLFAAHPTKPMVFLYGGYAKVAASTAAQRGHHLEDLWVLHLNLSASAKQGALPDCKWEVLPRRGTAPSKRSGMSSCVHRNRLLVFGGVSDTETENDVVGEFFNSLYAFDMDRMRWFELGLRGSVQGKKRRRAHAKGDGLSSAGASRDGGDLEYDDDGGEDSEAEEESAAAALGLSDDAFYVIVDGKFVKVEVYEGDAEPSLASADQLAAAAPFQESSSHAAAAAGSRGPESVADVASTPHHPFSSNASVVSSSATTTASAAAAAVVKPDAPWGGQVAPTPRMTAGTVVLGNRLLVLGGTREEGDRQITLDDVWSLDLTKMDAWVEIEAGAWRAQRWEAKDDAESNSSSSSNSDEEEDEDGSGAQQGDDDSEVDDEEDVEEMQEREERAQHVREMNEQIRAMRDELHVDDEANTPRPHEELRTFFARTSAYWLAELAKNRQLQQLRYGAELDRLTGKELRGEAFKLARMRFDMLQPLLDLLNALEEEQRLAEEAASEEARALAERSVNRGRAAKKQ